MRPVVTFLVLTLIVGTLALPHGRYSNQGSPFVWGVNALRQCREIGETCRNDYDCCGKTICRVLPGQEGPFSITFRCDIRSKFVYLRDN